MISLLTSDPPIQWFANPELDEPTPITITDEGRVYGHAALWGTCHRGFQGACVTPPPGHNGYAAFLLGGRRTSDEYEVAVGTITLGTSHAAIHLSAGAAMRHYEDTGLGVADVSMGDDQFGPWFAGSLRRGVTEEQRDELRAAKISGDWRARDSSSPMELIALLAVNVPGFPVPRPRVRVASGNREVLVAANICPRDARVRRALVAGMRAYENEMSRIRDQDEQLRVLAERALSA